MSGFPAGPDNAMQTGDLPRADRNVRRLQMSTHFSKLAPPFVLQLRLPYAGANRVSAAD
jgi:hypothetical protein